MCSLARIPFHLGDSHDLTCHFQSRNSWILSYFKILLITYKILNGQSTSWLESIIQEYHPSRTPRLSTCSLLCIPSMKSNSYGGRAFSAAAPELWNSIPQYIKRAETVETFKTRLKTFLFQKHYC